MKRETMWDIAFKIAFYLAAGLLLVLAATWYIRSLTIALTGRGQIVIADFAVVGRAEHGKNLDSSLALMLQARLSEVLRDWEQSVTQLTQARKSNESAKLVTDARKINSPGGGITGVSSTVYVEAVGATTKADLPSFVRQEMFTATVSVSGVDVGGVVAWMQRRLTHTRTLRFSFYEEKGYVQVAGDLSPAGIDGTLRITIKKQEGEEFVPLDRVVDTTAYEIARRWMSRAGDSEIGTLGESEFRLLAEAFSDAARFNRKADLGAETKGDFVALLPRAELLAKQVPGSYLLNSFAASVAQGAGRLDSELTFLEALRAIIQADKLLTPVGKKEKDSKLARIDERVKALQDAISQAQSTETAGISLLKPGPEDPEARKKIEADMRFAAEELDKLFQKHLPTPTLVLLAIDERNAYWIQSPNSYNAPPTVQYMPDVTYHELTIPYLVATVPLIDMNENQGYGEVLASLSDVLSEVLTQRKLGQNAVTADWVLAPGGCAWISGKDPRKDPRPLRSIKAPGTAYLNDPILGSDPTVDHMDKYDPEDRSRYRNAGILNKAFYETAIRIEKALPNQGTERAAQIWIIALPVFAQSPAKDFTAFAQALLQSAGAERSQVSEALQSVGLAKNEDANEG